MKRHSIPLLLASKIPWSLETHNIIGGISKSYFGQPRLFGFGSQMADNDPNEVDKAMKRQAAGKSKGFKSENVPGWEEKLASDSEAVVKAEHSEDCDVKELQAETIECLKDKDNNM